MLYEVDDVIDDMIQKKNVTMDNTFDVATLNVLWQTIASKRLGIDLIYSRLLQ